MPRRAFARPLAARTLRVAARKLGHELVPRSYYSPVPDLAQLPPGVLGARSPMRAIAFDLDRSVGELEQLKPFLDEFEPPPGFSWGNPMYDRVEADVLYAFVRHQKPRRIIELGSGFSSLVIAHAARRNSRDGQESSYRVYDPYAREFIRTGVDGLNFHSVSATDVPLAEFEALEAGDILFVDTTHTVKLGSEVNRIILDVLPLLAPGVLVHVHDVFLPYEYPIAFFEKGLFWAEQYLLQAFLTQNPNWEVAVPLFALVKERPDAVRRLVPSFTAPAGPGAFWIRSR